MPLHALKSKPCTCAVDPRTDHRQASSGVVAVLWYLAKARSSVLKYLKFEPENVQNALRSKRNTPTRAIFRRCRWKYNNSSRKYSGNRFRPLSLQLRLLHFRRYARLLRFCRGRDFLPLRLVVLLYQPASPTRPHTPSAGSCSPPRCVHGPWPHAALDVPPPRWQWLPVSWPQQPIWPPPR